MRKPSTYVFATQVSDYEQTDPKNLSLSVAPTQNLVATNGQFKMSHITDSKA